MFSPYYAWSGRADPLDHCAVNIALYGAGGRRWAMTERGRGAVRRDADHLSIGPSRLTWEDGALTIAFDEITAPVPRRLRGVVRLRPRFVNRQGFDLDARGRHVWRPIAPRADVEVSLESPGGAWRGEGYFDTNAGAEPLEEAFGGWDWSRAHLPGDSRIFYDVVHRSGERAHLALAFASDGALRTLDPPPRAPLPPTAWRIARTARGGPEAAVTVRETLEDTPFYARSALTGLYGGAAAQIVHESLSLDRLRSPVVKAMLPFRMPRALW